MSDMSSGHDSSSEVTESSEEAIAANMIKLAIAYSYAQQEPTPEANAVGTLISPCLHLDLGFRKAMLNFIHALPLGAYRV